MIIYYKSEINFTNDTYLYGQLMLYYLMEVFII